MFIFDFGVFLLTPRTVKCDAKDVALEVPCLCCCALVSTFPDVG